jgi:cell fate (sporulation/competence/biofilm development) regulator YlbF (YheA/YmcA/DUF963 family)
VIVIDETAQQLGRLIGQGEEYRALQRAREAVSSDKELVEQLRQLDALAGQLERRVASGEEPSQEDADAYERLFSAVQATAIYQGLVAAQSNFDKVMLRAQEQIMEGMRAGGQSRIITLS